MLKLGTIGTGTISMLLAVSLTTACPFGIPDDDDRSSRGDRGEDGNEDGGNGNNNGGGNTGGDVCEIPDDCPNTVCYCVERAGDFPSPVNSRRCINDRCALHDDSCDSVCGGFGMSWTGEYEILRNDNGGGGNNNGGGNTGGGNTGGGACEWENDNECDDSTGTGLCPDGNDLNDCF